MTTSPGASEVELTVFLDLIVKKTSLREGDDAVLQVTDGANGTTLVDSVRTIDADAPYYVEFDFGD